MKWHRAWFEYMLELGIPYVLNTQETASISTVYEQIITVGLIQMQMVHLELRKIKMPIIMCLDMFCVLTRETDAECHTVHSPLSHLASGSWIWRSGPKTSSIVTFFLRARLSSSPVERIRQINKQAWITCDVQQLYASVWRRIFWKKLSFNLINIFKHQSLLVSEENTEEILWFVLL